MHRACHDWSMSLEPKAGAAAKSDIDHRLLIPFLAHAILVQALILVIRITTSYRTIELDLPVVWLGIIATGFALIPAFTALPVGRWIDRGNDAKACRLGAALVLVACISRAKRARSSDRAPLIPVAALLRMRGFPVLMAASVVTVTALDLLVIYLPVLGTEREIDSDHIGLLLTLRSVASLISRVFYTRLIFAVGRLPLTLASMLASAVTFLILAIPLALPTMYAVLIALGFAMGIASTLTISSVVHLAPPDACGTALTLRMTGNRIGQIVFPALAGLLAAATGVAGVLLALGAGLAASGMAVALRKPSGKGG